MKRMTWTLRACVVFGIMGGVVAGGGASYAQDDSPTVAVFDFKIGTTETARVEVTEDGTTDSAEIEKKRKTSLLTNKLTTQLTKTDEISVVERKKMHQIMEESQLSNQELTDPQHATEVGKLLGAEYMIFGSITIFDPAVTVKELAYDAGTQKITSMTVGATMRLVNSETGEVEAAADMEARNTSKQTNPGDSSRNIPQAFMDDVFTELADKLSRKVVNTLNPIQVAKQNGDTVYLARAGLSEGDRYRVVKLGEPIKDPNSGEVIGRTSKDVAIIEVIGTMQSVSKARVTEWMVSQEDIPAGSICRPLSGA